MQNILYVCLTNVMSIYTYGWTKRHTLTPQRQTAQDRISFLYPSRGDHLRVTSDWIDRG